MLQSISDTSYDEDGSIVQHMWDFGDGETSSKQNPSHAYMYTPSSPVASSNQEDILENFTTTLTVIDDGHEQSTTHTTFAVYLSVPRSVANYYTADNLFNMDEILQAIAWWSNGDPAPLTNGRVIDTDTMLDMIARWAEQVPVDSSFFSGTAPSVEECVIAQRVISPRKVFPGESFRVSLELYTYQDIFGLGLDEGLSEVSGEWGQWQVKMVSGQDAIFNPKDGDWVWLNLQKGSTVFLTYEVRVPEDAVPGDYSIQGQLLSHLPEVNTQVEGESEVTVLPLEDLSPVVYPNPCQVGQSLTFSGLPPEARIFIYTIAGQKVKALTVPSGQSQIQWNLSNSQGEKVERGVYIYLIVPPQGEKYTGKVAIIK